MHQFPFTFFGGYGQHYIAILAEYFLMVQILFYLPFDNYKNTSLYMNWE